MTRLLESMAAIPVGAAWLCATCEAFVNSDPCPTCASSVHLMRADVALTTPPGHVRVTMPAEALPYVTAVLRGSVRAHRAKKDTDPAVAGARQRAVAALETALAALGV